MRKRLISLTAACLLTGQLGCSRAPETAPTSSGTISRTSAPVGQAPPTVAPEQRSSGKGDSGAISSASGAPEAGMGKAAAESSNYLVAQNKTAPSGSTAKRGYWQGEGTTGPSEPAESSPYLAAMVEPLSTFSADVDTASYSNLRRALFEGQMPYPEQIRVEEMVNYFNYDLPEPKAGQPFSVTSELSDCPWNGKARLLRLAIKTKAISQAQRPPCNLVFLLDVSGSMSSDDKLPLLKSSLKTLLDTLDDGDSIAIVTYAGDSGLVLPATPASEKVKILDAIDRLAAGGSTAGASGIELAYKVAQESATEHSVNRVILATDGDFNVGASSPQALQTLIEEKRKSGLSLSVLGFGQSGGGDKTMETLADHGNGNYSSIHSLQEARKVLVEESGANLVTVAKDVKFQIAFNPAQVERYRLIGYANRRLQTEDFADDKKDAGDLGAGHSVTVLYEIIPPSKAPELDVVKTVLAAAGGNQPSTDQLALLKLRYKTPGDDASDLLEVPVSNSARALAKASPDQRWAVAVTELGMKLQDDDSVKDISFGQIADLAESGISKAGDAYRLEFLQLVAKAKALSS